MGTFGDSTYSDESQNSQVLKNAVLAGSMPGPPPRSPLPAGSLPPREDPSQSPRHSQLSYHLHGLAPTQSQSQPKDASLFREASQKENAPTCASPDFVVFKPTETNVASTTEGAPHALHPIFEGAPMVDVVSHTGTASKGLPCDMLGSNATGPVACSARRDNANTVQSAGARENRVSPRANSKHKKLVEAEESFAGPVPTDIELKRHMRNSSMFQEPVDATQESDVEETRPDIEEVTKRVCLTSPKSLRTRFRELSVTRTSSQSQPEASQNEESQPPNSYPQAQEEDDDDFFPPPQQPRRPFDLSDDADYHPRQDIQGEQSEPESLASSFATQPSGPLNWEETQPSEASNRPATGQTESSHDEYHSDAEPCEATQPSESSGRPATGFMAEAENESFEATQPTPASNLPATGYIPDPSSSMQPQPPSSFPHLLDSDMDIIPDSEPSQPTPVQKDVSSPDMLHPKNDSAGIPPIDAAMEEDEEELTAEEEDADASQDIPLAIVIANKASSKAKSTASKAVKRDASGSLMPPPAKRTRTDPLPAVTSLFDEDDVIPSSDPQERLLEAAASAQKPTRLTRGKAKKAATMPITPARTRGHGEKESDEETTIHANTAPDNDDVLTELADDESEHLGGRGSTHKRKRVPSSSVKDSARSLRSANTYTPPPGRSAARLKSGSIARSASASATRVLALWKADLNYYVGTVHSETGTPQQYRVHFDDGEEDDLNIAHMRRCEFREGDSVMVAARPKNSRGVIVDASRIFADSTVVVRVSDNTEYVVETRELLIPCRTVMSKWTDRTLTADEIITRIKPRGKSSPTPSKSADISSWSKNTQKIFDKVGFVTTMSPGQDDWEREKKTLQATIKEHGGVVIDDWCQVFKMDGTQTLAGKPRWVLTQKEITLLRKELDRVFLLSDDANHKPKFLIALALGVPCLKLEWLWESADDTEEKEWLPYLLPAGTSEILSARFTQMVDAKWGDSPENIHDVTNNPVPPRLFADKNILCVSPDFVQAKASKRGNSDKEQGREAKRMIPRIILCMGAERVEAVGNVAHASKPARNYDYIVFLEPDEAKKAAKALHLDSCVPFCWVKECLITGRLLPRD